MRSAPQFRLAVEERSRRPLCILLQAAAGCDYSILPRVARPATWIVGGDIGPCMVIRGTETQLREFFDAA